MMNSKHIKSLNNLEFVSRPIVYWMSRDQQVRYNWALLYCQAKALEYQMPILIVF